MCAIRAQARPTQNPGADSRSPMPRTKSIHYIAVDFFLFFHKIDLLSVHILAETAFFKISIIFLDLFKLKVRRSRLSIIGTPEAPVAVWS